MNSRALPTTQMHCRLAQLPRKVSTADDLSPPHGSTLCALLRLNLPVVFWKPRRMQC